MFYPEPSLIDTLYLRPNKMLKTFFTDLELDVNCTETETCVRPIRVSLNDQGFEEGTLP